MNNIFQCLKVYEDGDSSQTGWLTSDYQHRLSQKYKKKIDITEAENKMNKQCKSYLCFDSDECKLVIKYIENGSIIQCAISWQIGINM